MCMILVRVGMHSSVQRRTPAHAALSPAVATDMTSNRIHGAGTVVGPPAAQCHGHRRAPGERVFIIKAIITIRNSMDLFFYGCLVRFRRGEIRRAVWFLAQTSTATGCVRILHVYNIRTYNTDIFIIIIIFKRIRTYPTRDGSENVYQGPPERCEYDEKVPPPAGFLLYAPVVGLTATG